MKIDKSKKNFNKIKRKVKRKINSCCKKMKLYAKTNVLFFTFVITSIFNAIVVSAFTIGELSISPILASLSVILVIGSFGYLFKPKHQFKYYFVIAIILTAICIINAVYYKNYISFVSVSLLKTSSQLGGVDDSVVKNLIAPRDFIFLLQLLCLVFVNKYLKRHEYYKKVSKIEIGNIRFINTLISGMIVLGMFIMTINSVDVSRLSKQWNKEYIVVKFGIYVYQGNDIISTVKTDLNPLFGKDKALEEVKEYYKEKFTEQLNTNNEYTNLLKGKNVIMIHAESMQNYLLNTSFNGVDVVPNLKKIANEGLYFSNFYAQESVGTSSDSEFTLSSSLLPSSSGTVFVSYFDRDYITNQKLLGNLGYYSFSMHGNKCTMWNRNNAHKSLGYDNFYCYTKDYDIDEVKGLGLSDKSFFRQSTEILKDINSKNKNWFGNLIMLSNHTPFNDDGEAYSDYDVTYKYKDETTGEEKSAPYMEGTKLGYYFKSAHYADEALGEFMTELETAGLLENAVIVLYGDHDSKIKKNDYIRLYNYDYKTDALKSKDDPNYVDVDYYNYELNRKVPFIIWTKDSKLRNKLQGNITKVMAMYDISPTLANMLGYKNKYALGHDIFSINDNVVIFPDGNWLTDKVYYNRSKEEFKVLNSEDSISVDYVTKYNEYSEKTLLTSDNIIIYNLIKELEKEEENKINE